MAEIKNLSIIDKFLDEEEISYLLNTNDVLILPYIDATQSGIVTLGMASGLPIICTNVGGLKEQIGCKMPYFVVYLHPILIIKLNYYMMIVLCMKHFLIGY